MQGFIFHRGKTHTEISTVRWYLNFFLIVTYEVTLLRTEEKRMRTEKKQQISRHVNKFKVFYEKFEKKKKKDYSEFVIGKVFCRVCISVY